MALTIGAKAPDFKLLDTERKERSLSEFLVRKTLLAFYPGAFTGVCTKEMCAFRDAMANFNNLDAQVVGISVDGPFANKAFAEQNKLTFPLLSDYTAEISKKFGGIHEDFAGMKGYNASKRAVFVLDKNGIVKYAWISDNPGVEPPYEEINKSLNSI
ncbi:MAG: peroxiredoxin [Ignavibacteriales bacterium]|nr:peroxiredoxin [Ignavibacteriales bacterium]